MDAGVGGQDNDGKKEAREFPPAIAPTTEKVQTTMVTGSEQRRHKTYGGAEKGAGRRWRSMQNNKRD